MATNPMQKKTRTAFILGALLMLVIAAIVVALLYMKINEQQKQINNYKLSEVEVYVLNQDVKSGQVLTFDMFTKKKVSSVAVPTGATSDIMTTLSSYSLTDTKGRAIYSHVAVANSEDTNYYYYSINGKEHQIYIDTNGQEELASYLKANDKAYFYAGDNKTQKTDVTIAESAVVAKVNMNANTVITGSLIARTNEITSKDLRKEEYNIISLPVDLNPNEYVDIRLKLPNGQNYIVVSKKKVTIPMVNGEYLSDTIQMNLTEEEILIMSSAIVENFKTTGSILYATRYTEAGLQDAATMTYYPNSEVQQTIQNNPNVVLSAIQGILKNREQIRKGIDSAVSGNKDTEGIQTKTEESVTSTQEARKNYLQSLQGTMPVTE